MIAIRLGAIALAALAGTGTSYAQNKVGQTPAVGAEATATVGSPILEKFRYDAVKVAVTQVDVVRGSFTGDIKIAAGDPGTVRNFVREAIGWNGRDH